MVAKVTIIQYELVVTENRVDDPVKKNSGCIAHEY